MDETLQRLVDQVQAARADKRVLDIRGGGTKAFYGGPIVGEPLDVRALTGISSYEPSELVITARGGTSLAELETTLAEQGQCLPFEPPRFGEGSTVGGMVAAGLAGPARVSVGGVRDYVLGAKLLNGRAELLAFGGTVMKNVAGYDVSRTLAGSMGVLGVICEVSLKVLPVPPATRTLRLEADQAGAIRRLNEWGGQPLPLNASAWWDGMLVLRLSGAGAAVRAAHEKIGGEVIETTLAATFWNGMRDHSDEFFVGAAKAVDSGAALWRLSVPATTAPLKLSGEQLLEWGGAQRWICTTAPAAVLREAAQLAGGHAVLFRGQDKSAGSFATPTPAMARLQHDLQRAFDPDGIFNPGRLLPAA
ncbi:MAG: glycolate oxidase subunit GlcE [Rubrivivax sp.]|nr:glycolate oxidase subunit GlcE [Rubrivivax sp.]